MLGIIDLDDTPWIDSGTDKLSVNLDFLFRPNDGEREKGLNGVKIAKLASVILKDQKVAYAKLAVVLNRFFVVFLNVIGEVIHRDIVMLNILHDLDFCVNERLHTKILPTDPLLESLELAWCQRVCLANDRDNIYTRREAAHEFNVHFTQTEGSL